jgi:putative FmdB family regulatory protein
MPIYEYECPKHGQYEVSQRITEPALTACTIESCGQPVRKLISHTSFALKGGGWYATDYGGANSGA